MIQPPPSLQRGFNKVCSAVAAAIPQTHSKVNCSGPYTPGQSSTTTLDRANTHSASDSKRGSSGKMGKSNKFDYSNRPNSGAKMGGIIGRDLKSQADKVLKEADKQAEKARKVSTGSAASCSSVASEARDAHVHILDIKVPSKKLGDEGACAMAEGLESALRKGTYEAFVALEDLDLSDNGITTVSLARLAPIISLAKHELKTLNLSNNAIMVETDQQAAEWESFLRSFKDCKKLRRLDLSGNINLGAKALEILAHVHIDEKLINPIPITGNSSVVSLAEEIDEADQETPRAPTFAAAASLADARFIKRRCGLRSIPFLTLYDTGLNDAGALWLSYVIEDHHYPSQLIDELNATHASSTIQIYQQGERGLHWNEKEPGVTRDGLFVLRKAETIRQQTMLADQATAPTCDSQGETGAEGEDVEAGDGSRRSMDRRHSRAARGDRRASVRSIHTADGEMEISELDSARKKLQRSIMAVGRDGASVSSVELWQTGMRLAYTSRLLHTYGPDLQNSERFHSGPPLFDLSTRASGRKDPVSRPATPRTNINGHRSASDAGRASTPDKRRKQGTYAATLTANTGAVAGEPELAITEVTNSPTTPKLIFKSHRKEAFSDGGDLQTDLVVKKLDALILRADNPQSYVRYQEKRIAEAGGESAFRDRKVISHLPSSVIQSIAEHTVSERRLGLLSEKQRAKIASLSEERRKPEQLKEWRKMSESAQAWAVLESIECLEYERK